MRIASSKCFEVERQLFDILQAQVIRDRTQGKDHVIVFQFAASAPASSRTTTLLFEIDPSDTAAHEVGPAEAATQRHADMTGLQATSRHFGEHGSKQERVGVAHQRNGDGAAELLFEIFRSLHVRQIRRQV